MGLLSGSEVVVSPPHNTDTPKRKHAYCRLLYPFFYVVYLYIIFLGGRNAKSSPFHFFPTCLSSKGGSRKKPPSPAMALKRRRKSKLEEEKLFFPSFLSFPTFFSLAASDFTNSLSLSHSKRERKKLPHPQPPIHPPTQKKQNFSHHSITFFPTFSFQPRLRVEKGTKKETFQDFLGNVDDASKTFSYACLCRQRRRRRRRRRKRRRLNPEVESLCTKWPWQTTIVWRATVGVRYKGTVLCTRVPVHRFLCAVEKWVGGGKVISPLLE